jgi:methylmalonyl-CoA mutase C-terminal domain/subunit
LLFGGGIIADEDIAKLKKMGVGMLFTPGASTQEIIDYLNDVLPKARKQDKIL